MNLQGRPNRSPLILKKPGMGNRLHSIDMQSEQLIIFSYVEELWNVLLCSSSRMAWNAA